MEGKNKIAAAVVLIAAIFLVAGLASVRPVQRVAGDVVTVADPVSQQTYYGRLAGAADTFVIEKAEPFRLDAQLLVPDTGAGTGTVVAQVYTLQETPQADGKVWQLLTTLGQAGGEASAWNKYRDFWLGNDYLRTEVLRQDLESGRYYLKVYDTGETEGRYALELGSRADYSPQSVFASAGNMPWLETEYWGKSLLSALLSPLGLALLVLVLAVLWLLARWLWRRNRRRGRLRIVDAPTAGEEDFVQKIKDEIEGEDEKRG